jgi:hypothetical protein
VQEACVNWGFPDQLEAHADLAADANRWEEKRREILPMDKISRDAMRDAAHSMAELLLMPQIERGGEQYSNDVKSTMQEY